MEALSQSFIITPTIFRVARVFRVGRLLRFYTNMRGVRRLLITLLISLPALVNIGALLFLIIFIYAIIGMSMFAHVKHTGAVDDIVNFETFLNSILLLFRLSTSAGWNDVLEPLMIQPPDCDLSHKDLPNGNCGLPSFAVCYFVSFVLITSLIIVNMYIAIIMENLHEACQAENTGLTEEDLDMFYKKWQIYDPRATQYIPHSHLSDFVDSLDEPMRISKPNKYVCINLHIPIHQVIEIKIKVYPRFFFEIIYACSFCYCFLRCITDFLYTLLLFFIPFCTLFSSSSSSVHFCSSTISMFTLVLLHSFLYTSFFIIPYVHSSSSSFPM